MPSQITFLGAAQNVTGSRHLLDINGTRILIDCGLYQEREFQSRNWKPFPVDPKSISAILLTHAHLDHCGYLPMLVKGGFCGRIYCTPATIELAQLILLDCAYLQEEDAENKRLRHLREGRQGSHPEVPLYTVEDAKACFPLFSPIHYNNCISLGHKIHACFYNAGHVLGSSIIQVNAPVNGSERTILFTGDLGRPDAPILKDPDIFKSADYILLESTYGDKTHEAMDTIENVMANAIVETYKRGGNVLIPSFALERAQEVLYYLNKLQIAGRIPYQNIFIDSPMASKITEVFRQHPELYDSETIDLIKLGRSPFALPGLYLTASREESQQINDCQEPCIIIAGSGMCTGGRIKGHLTRNIQNEENVIFFVGYQAEGTLGRQIQTGSREVRIYGKMYPVRAQVLKIPGFSAHADRNELLQWLSNFQRPLRGTFLVHGEAASAKDFSKLIQARYHWPVNVPNYMETYPLT